MNSNKTLKIIHILVFILSISLLVLLGIKLFPIFANLGTPEGQAKFQQEITNQGISRYSISSWFAIATNFSTYFTW